MGNAAQTIHPIGAQGFNLGLRDALTFAELLPDAGDPGDAAFLAAYADARREDRERTLAFSDGLARATANRSAGMHLLRSLGLVALANVPGLSAPLVSGAMGFRGRVPQLSRGAT
jgi:2-octaprenyl-6-methoxyphenol hydroxylase